MRALPDGKSHTSIHHEVSMKALLLYYARSQEEIGRIQEVQQAG